MDRAYCLQQATYWQKAGAMWHRHASEYLRLEMPDDASKAQIKARLAHGTSVDYMAAASLSEEHDVLIARVVGLTVELAILRADN